MGKRIDCVTIAQNVKDKVKKEITDRNLSLTLAVVLVGDNQASQIYVRNKVKVCEEVGIKSLAITVPKDVTQESLEGLIDSLNRRKDVNGILVQLPLPKHLDSYRVINMIHPYKDVDGLNTINQGRLFGGIPSIVPCTPQGVITIIDSIGYDLSGKHVTVLGRSNLFGKPMAQLCLQRDATVSICHSKTPDWRRQQLIDTSDVVIVAIGKPKDVKFTMRSTCSLVIDVGINRVDGKIVGDVDEDTIRKYVDYTPVPKGVGVLTTATLMENVIKCYDLMLTLQ